MKLNEGQQGQPISKQRVAKDAKERKECQKSKVLY